MLPRLNPFEYFTDTNGDPLDGGYVYIGTANQNPKTSPVTVYFDSAMTIPAPQPLRTTAGRIVKSGAPAAIYSATLTFSILVENKSGQQVFYSAESDSSSLAQSTGASLIGFLQTGTGATSRTVQNKLSEFVSIVDFGADPTGASDSTAAIQLAINASRNVLVPKGTYKIISEVTLESNTTFVGQGQGVSVLNFYKTSNPGASEFMLAARSKSNITIEHLTLTSNAYDDGLFNVGTYTAGPPKKYTGGDAGNINGLLISSCTDVTVRDVEVRYFNYHGIRVSVEGGTPATHYNKRLTFDRIYGHHCLSAPLDILGAMDFKVINSTFTDNGNFTASYIDGSTGYGVVLGRTPSGSQLRSFGGICSGNFCARNARHGIDIHAGANITIENNICEDNLIMGICVLDYAGSADDSYVGDVIIRGNNVYNTSWVESRQSLLTYRDDGSERDDSNGIFVTNNGSLLRRVFIEGNTIHDIRHRQLVANTTSDLVGGIYASANSFVRIANNTIHNTVTGYWPSSAIEVTCPVFEILGNSVQISQRSTVSKPAFGFNASGGSGKGLIANNHFELYGCYSDSAGTQAAYPMMRKINGELTFTGNTVIQTSQVTRGGIWYDTGTNKKYGFNGILAVNRGNTLYPDGTTAIEYDSRIKGSMTIYLSDAGSGRYDGLSSGNRFVATSAEQFRAIINDMPFCESGLIVMIDTDQLDWGSDGGVTIPDWQDNITFRGLSSETANSMTKTGGIKTTGNNLIICPERSQNINFEYLYLKCAGTYVLHRPANVRYCAIEGSTNGQFGVYCEYKSSYIRNNRFKGPGVGTSVAIGGFLGANITSQINDSDASAFAYGLNANGAAIRKNSTQPTGATANELAQNGGTIA
jgi:parallel beta-helix repeat protein